MALWCRLKSHGWSASCVSAYWSPRWLHLLQYHDIPHWNSVISQIFRLALIFLPSSCLQSSERKNDNLNNQCWNRMRCSTVKKSLYFWVRDRTKRSLNDCSANLDRFWSRTIIIQNWDKNVSSASDCEGAAASSSTFHQFFHSDSMLQWHTYKWNTYIHRFYRLVQELSVVKDQEVLLVLVFAGRWDGKMGGDNQNSSPDRCLSSAYIFSKVALCRECLIMITLTISPFSAQASEWCCNLKVRPMYEQLIRPSYQSYQDGADFVVDNHTSKTKVNSNVLSDWVVADYQLYELCSLGFKLCK